MSWASFGGRGSLQTVSLKLALLASGGSTSSGYNNNNNNTMRRQPFVDQTLIYIIHTIYIYSAQLTLEQHGFELHGFLSVINIAVLHGLMVA